MMEVTAVRGGVSYRGYKKGSGGGRTPVEASDSLHSTTYARILDLIGEGEIVGLVDGLRSVYLNKTPLQNADGSMNFAGVSVDVRNGTQMQSHISGFPASERPVSVGIELEFGKPWVAAISNLNLSAIRITLGVNGLSKTVTSGSKAGDVNGHRVEYAVDVQTDGGAWDQVINTAFDGKTTSQYRRTHRVDLPRAQVGWQIRVRRLTPQANSATIADSTLVDTYTEVVDGKLCYPMSALAGVQVDASQFNSIPTRAYHIRGRIIRVPSNYDPETRIYTGTWDGTFKLAWTNNPAWIFYDIVTNTRYGLGSKIPAGWVNKWELYRIGTYCDEFVPDGKGGQEPRFTCNVYIQQAADAYRVLQDLAGVFRGLVYWAAGTAIAVADMPTDYSYIYTQANVESGVFTYTGSRGKDRPTLAIVSYNDPADMFRQKTVSYQDDALISRYGVRRVEITSFGCTSEAQALRIAKWAILTASRETQGVSFTVGLDGTVAAPGQIVMIQDNQFAGRRIGGRIAEVVSNDTIVVDAATVVNYGDTLTIMLPDGTVETRTVILSGSAFLTADDTTRTVDTTQITADATVIKGSSEETLRIRVQPAFSQLPIAGAVWALESREVVSQLFKIVSVTQGDTPAKFNIVAVQHEPGKYENVDYGTKIDTRPVTVVPPSVQAPVASVAISSFNVLTMGVDTTTIAIEWPAAENASRYQIEWRRNNGNWVTVVDTATLRVEIPNAYTGEYIARVRAVSALDSPSLWTVSDAVAITGYMDAPPALTRFTASTNKVFGIDLAWGMPDVANIVQRTEIMVNEANSLASARVLTNVAYPQDTYTLAGLAAGAEFFFWARLVDKNGLPGPWFPGETFGVRGAASSSAGDILGYLEGQITESQLAQSLIEKIESADGSAVEVEAIKTQLAAMYTIKTQLTVDGVPYLAGIGVGVENNEGVITSQILLAAQRVAVLNEANGTTSVPFVIQNGQVFMNSAFIANASIGSAKIADWLESDATNSLGQKVWRLNMRTGEMQFNGVSTGSGRLVINNNVVMVYDGNGTLRVRMGIW